MIFLLGVMFIIRMQPVFIVRMLILITFVYSYIIYRVLGTFWFRYVLLIVILRGVLVVFTYMVTLIPNESFEIYSLILLFIIMVIFIVEYMKLYWIDIGLISVNLWITYFGLLRIFLVGFLLVIILLVVSLRYIGDGAFRVRCLNAWKRVSLID